MVSRYKGVLTEKGIVEGVAVISKTFPALPVGFFDILIDRIKACRFSDERFHDAIVNVIDTCHYPTPTIADFIQFDKRIPCFNNMLTDETR